MMLKDIKILIVDDSRFYRNIISKALQKDKLINIVGSVWNGVEAIDFINNKEIPDIITLDIEMPEMDGIETLKGIMEFNKKNQDIADIGVIMVSSLSVEGTEITIEALESGAFDFITKTAQDSPEKTINILSSTLLKKINSYMGKKFGIKEKITPVCNPISEIKKIASDYKAILIGVSTGGPEALQVLLPKLTKLTKLPVFIVQHMPPQFTLSLANNLNKRCDKATISEASHMVKVQENNVYIAPGGKHLLLKRNLKNEVVTSISDNPPENGLKPSIDVMFRSAQKIYGGNVIVIIMTGMGADGTRGLRPLKREGAFVIAQDENSSVVWGMPRNAIAAGFVDSTLPLGKISGKIKSLLKKS